MASSLPAPLAYSLIKSARDMNVKQLTTNSSFTFYLEWKSALKQWLGAFDLQVEQISPAILEQLSSVFLDGTLRDSVQIDGVLAADWSTLLKRLRAELGLNTASLRARL